MSQLVTPKKVGASWLYYNILSGEGALMDALIHKLFEKAGQRAGFFHNLAL